VNARTVLVVEDDRDIRETLEDALTDDGFSVMAATNGRQALDLLPSIRRPFAVVLDILMPVMNGREFYERMRRDPRFQAVPVLVATSDASGAPPGVLTMTKPVPLSTLISTVRSFFEDPGGSPGDAGASGTRISAGRGTEGKSALSPRGLRAEIGGLAAPASS
jgi:CheY-like chemotaxis protein